MRRLSKILFAVLIGLSFVAGSATAFASGYRRHGRGYKHAGKHGKHGKGWVQNPSFGLGKSNVVVGNGGKGGGSVGSGGASVKKIKVHPRK